MDKETQVTATAMLDFEAGCLGRMDTVSFVVWDYDRDLMCPNDIVCVSADHIRRGCLGRFFIQGVTEFLLSSA